jgi:hypothetical protein
MTTTDPYDDGGHEVRQEFTTNDFRITRALVSLLITDADYTVSTGLASCQSNA